MHQLRAWLKLSWVGPEVARMTSGGQEATLRAPDPIKPRLRRSLHAAAAPVVLAAGLVLVTVAAPGVPRVVAVVYARCGLLLFATSGLYHRGRWSPHAQGRLRRIDHSNVYLLIAGTYTPVVTAAGIDATLFATAALLLVAGSSPSPSRRTGCARSHA
jgi:predicted membrane channel-forming protein YqfA (hemolysin III family)